MKTKIKKWGNSLGLRLPKSVLESKSLKDGASVRVTSSGNKIILEPVRNDVTLDDLVKKISPKNLHQVTDWGKPTGKEIW